MYKEKIKASGKLQKKMDFYILTESRLRYKESTD